jgi:metal-responsive CopG/Arc/MetJ family transcriptional regulator
MRNNHPRLSVRLPLDLLQRLDATVRREYPHHTHRGLRTYAVKQAIIEWLNKDRGSR